MPTQYSISGTPFEYYFIRKNIFGNQTPGALWLQGSNNYGQLGDNTTVAKSSPVQTVSGGTNWKQVSASQGTTFAIKTDGTLWSWGNGNNSQLGAGGTRSSPLQIGNLTWKSVSFSGTNGGIGGGIRTDGTLWLWGYNFYFNLGLGGTSTTNSLSPVQTAVGGTNWKQVSTSILAMIALKDDGTLWTWGRGGQGQFGDGTTGTRSTPVQMPGIDWKSVSGAYEHVAAIKNDGTLWTWGGNGFGQLGDNTTGAKSSPVQTIASGNNWKQVVVDIFGSSTAAIKTDGTLWLWGRNSYSSLGDNTQTNRSSPVQTVSGGTNWKQIGYSAYRGYGVIKTDGTLWAWGSGLGLFPPAPSTPIQIFGGGVNWKTAAVTGGGIIAVG